ncbi:daunorubicin resistance protein DrrC [Acinetobacter sp. NRRL B-65365]|uniref:ATP-binding cassette domain-containing protein n=1 Tax=Acinetobacter sp. NRRL B-65365 TaxID=1785092 RepID=UPI00079FDB84|nr:excinuclease ABC subunit UvrA [Acinetobacter sp. NRRL B-65365]KYQ83905.1 daunorubicin resistance protein DrrC [Acinetobacter sp. NRRL B-65365]
MSSRTINIYGARQNNLKNISLKIPKNKIVVFTGVSGSGKSSLVFETIGAEAQRQINETQDSFVRNRLQHFGVADVDKIENLNVPVIINQKPLTGNIRSTIATITDIYANLRLLFSRMGKPFVGYSHVFSFNHPNGMCPQCDGIGLEQTIDIYKILDLEKSLNEGPIDFPTYQPHAWRWTRYADSGYFDLDKKLKDYDAEEWELFLNAAQHKPHHPRKDWRKTALYEGLIPRFERNFLKGEAQERNRYRHILDKIITVEKCSLCQGQRLNQTSLSCKIQGKNISDCTALSVAKLLSFIESIENEKLETVLHEIRNKLHYLNLVGLSYLTLDRVSNTLSGGESQRIKMVKHLGNSLVDLLYIFDEPSIGLHPKDLENIIQIIQKIKDKGNSVLLVEHDPDLIRIADHVIDMGPLSGQKGGEVIYQGSFADLKSSSGLTGQFFQRPNQYKQVARSSLEKMTIKNARLFNLKNISVDIPKNCLSVVTGVAGSGKSTLMSKVLPQQYPEVKIIDQSAITATIRSNLLTYLDLLDSIRQLYAQQNKVSAKLFSFNSEGACPQCKGSGIEKIELAFLDDVEMVCEVCHGSGYAEQVLNYLYNDKNIADALKMTVAEAYDFFEVPKLKQQFKTLIDLGLDYIAIGQRLNSFSGGERQRLKLSRELDQTNNIFVLDEPSSGLHPSDTVKLIQLLNTIVDQGNTVIVIEHNLEIMTQADWIVDIGPLAGEQGGELMFAGPVSQLLENKESYTAHYLRDYLNR